MAKMLQHIWRSNISSTQVFQNDVCDDWRSYGLELVKTIGNKFSTSLKTIKTLLRVNGNEFRTCPVCPKCNVIYEKQSCTKTLPDGHIVSKTCTNVEWPNHPRKDNRSPCGEKLMKKVRGKTGNIFWYPRKVAVFQSLFSSLKRIFNSQNFKYEYFKYVK